MSMPNQRWVPLAIAAALALSGCSGDPQAKAPAASIPATAPSSPATSAAAAADVLAQLGRAGLPMSNPVVQDENNDPNNLLGRPNGYVSRASFDVAGAKTDGDPHSIDRGGVIEVWPSETAARDRSKFIQDTLKTMAVLGTEYHYVRGPVLLRITGAVKPSVAAQFEAALLR